MPWAQISAEDKQRVFDAAERGEDCQRLAVHLNIKPNKIVVV